MVFEGLVDLGIALLLAVAIAEYAKVRHKSDSGFNWVAASGVFFLFAGTFASAPAITSPLSFGQYGVIDIFTVLAWIFALVGSVIIVKDTVLER